MSAVLPWLPSKLLKLNIYFCKHKTFSPSEENTKVDTIMKFSGKLLIFEQQQKKWMLSLSYTPLL